MMAENDGKKSWQRNLAEGLPSFGAVALARHGMRNTVTPWLFMLLCMSSQTFFSFFQLNLFVR
jgi:hypothetical protein